MKTTIDLADDLALALKKQASLEGIPLRTAVHEALRLWLKAKSKTERPRRIRCDVGIMSGKGLSPQAASRSWDDLRDLSYKHDSLTP